MCLNEAAGSSKDLQNITGDHLAVDRVMFLLTVIGIG